MIDVLTARTNEINSEVRRDAFKSLSRLQNYRDEADPVVKLYIDGMRYDESAEVRATCVENIGLNRLTLLDVITRTGDIDTKVRLAAYKRITNKVKISVMKPSQVEDLLRHALNDEGPGSIVKYTQIPK